MYKEKKKKVRESIHRGKAKYFRDKLKDSKKDTSKIWKTVKELVPRKSNNSNVHSFSDIQNKVEEFNEFFASVGKNTYERTQANLRNSNTPIQNDVATSPEVNDRFRPQPVSVDTVILTFKSLRETNAVGADNIPYRFIKDSLPIIAFYLTIIINTIIVTGTNPQLWKDGIIVPAFKSGDLDKPSNYRPISLLTILSKLLEKIIAVQLIDFLETKHLLAITQHGFRSKLSTETALICATNKIYDNIDNNKITAITLCDLSKAFDSVNPILLLKKLNSLGIDSFWFKDYLTGRTQSVKIGEHTSTKKNVTFGVPQGSMLGLCYS